MTRPKYKASKKVTDIHDLSWVGTEVHSVDGITPLHRRRAAGLVDQPHCAIRWQKAKTVSSLGDDDIRIIEGPACSPARCKGRVRCYNHLGADQAFDEKAKQKMLADQLPDEVEIRAGPAGLRNLGATCYANAFLQVWYYNRPFREAVYDSAKADGSPLFHLALLFACMQIGIRPVVDPTSLISSLNLDTELQQDAAEFSKLFIDFVAHQMQNGSGSDNRVKQAITEQIEGVLEYVTTCECGYQSATASSFRELELNVKSKATLDECIKTFLLPESLVGDNKYRCSRCGQLRNATRQTRLKALPPLLHISLLRFTFDLKTHSRKKSNAIINFSKKLSLSGQAYQLQAIVTHQGNSAHHGHFVADVWDEELDDWLLCNDEQIQQMSRRPTKKRRPDPDNEDIVPIHVEKTTYSSKDAYMLVYRKNRSPAMANQQGMPLETTNGQSSATYHDLKLPAWLVSLVDADNAAYRVEMEENAQRRAEVELGIEALLQRKRDLLAIIDGDDALIPKESLIKWLRATTVSEHDVKFDFSPLLCEHDFLDPYKTHEGRLVSTAAFQRLCPDQNFYDVCPMCVATLFVERQQGNERADTVAIFDQLNDGPGNRLLPQKWVTEWKAAPGSITMKPDDPAYGVCCAHGKRFNTINKAITVTAETIGYLSGLLGKFSAPAEDSAPCEECSNMQADVFLASKARRDEVALDRRLLKLVDERPFVLGVDLYVIPDDFYDAWVAYVKGSGPMPKLEIKLCPHGGIDFDPAIEDVKRITDSGWEQLCGKYGYQSPVTIQLGGQRLPGASTQVVKVDPPVCSECRTRRLTDFRETTLTVELVSEDNEAAASDLLSNTRRVTRSKEKIIQVSVTKDTSIKDIKVEVYGRKGISPICQRIMYQGKSLPTEATIASAGILDRDRLICVVIEEKEDEGDVGVKAGRRIEGFGGTALTGNINCPFCTSFNQPTALQCVVCEKDFTTTESL